MGEAIRSEDKLISNCRSVAMEIADMIHCLMLQEYHLAIKIRGPGA